MSKAIFGLTAIPLTKTEIPGVFGAQSDPVVRALDNPPVIRPHGFDLEHGSSSKIVEGELRRAGITGFSSLELWRDGTLTFVVDGYGFLCWWTNRPPEGVLRINPLVLCESTYNFVQLTQKIYPEATPIPNKIEYRIFLRDIAVGGRRAELAPGLGWMSFEVGKSPEGKSNMDAGVEWDRSEIDPGLIAHQLVREVFRWFGMADTTIPFVSVSMTGHARIDPEKIRGLDRTTVSLG